MVTFLSYASLMFAGLLAVPMVVLVTEVVAATTLGRRQRSIENDNPRPRLAVLVPAHNEGKRLLPTLMDIRQQLLPGDRLLVVADNCTDDTAAVAASAGAEVVERHDADRIGKGYALDRGIAHLSSAPPETVVMIDADCRLGEKAIDNLANTCAVYRRPVQALDLMVAPADCEINLRVAEFAWRIRNWVRPLGLSALNLPCPLMGTGMAFPWNVIRDANLASGNIVEDQKLGLDVTMAGTPPVFCPAAVVTSVFPASNVGAQAQRKRWEQGTLGIIMRKAVPLIGSALFRRNWTLLALALEACVPPLTLFWLLIVGTFAVAMFAALAGSSSAPLILASLVLMGFILSVCLSWWKWGRDLLTAHTMASLFPYILNKLRLYCELIVGKRAIHWVRADRRGSHVDR